MVATDIKMILLAPCSPCAFSPNSPWFQKNAVTTESTKKFPRRAQRAFQC